MSSSIRSILSVLVLTLLSACTGIFGDFSNPLDPGTEYHAMIVSTGYGSTYIEGVSAGKGINYQYATYVAGTKASTGTTDLNAHDITREGKPYVMTYNYTLATPNGGSFAAQTSSSYVPPQVVATDGKTHSTIAHFDAGGTASTSFDLTANDVVYANLPNSADENDPNYYYGGFFTTDGVFFGLYPGIGTIKRVSATGVITNYAGMGTKATTAGQGDGAASATTSLAFIPWMKMSPAGELYFLESQATVSGTGTSAYFVTSEPYYLRKIDTQGVLTTLMGKGSLSPLYEGNGQAASTAKSTYVYDLVFDSSGSPVFIAQGCVARINADGTFVVIAGSPVVRMDFENNRFSWKSAGDLRLASPNFLSYDSALDIFYFSDSMYNADPTKAPWRILALYKGTLPTITP